MRRDIVDAWYDSAMLLKKTWVCKQDEVELFLRFDLTLFYSSLFGRDRRSVVKIGDD